MASGAVLLQQLRRFVVQIEPGEAVVSVGILRGDALHHACNGARELHRSAVLLAVCERARQLDGIVDIEHNYIFIEPRTDERSEHALWAIVRSIA